MKKGKGPNKFAMCVLTLALSVFAALHAITAPEKAYAVLGVPEIDQEALDLYDEIDFLEELNFDNRDARRFDIDRVYGLCDQYCNEKSVKVTDVPLYITNYYKLLDMKETLEYYDNAALSGFLGEIALPYEADINDDVNLTISVKNLKTAAMSGLTYEVSYRRVVLEDKENKASGTFELAAGESKTINVPFKALEGSYSIVSVVFKNNENQTLSQTQKPLYITPPGYYFGDFHTHSNLTDGAPSLAENMRYALRHGMNILSANDHNAYMETEEDVGASSKSVTDGMGETFLHLKGTEFTDYNGGKGHAVYHNSVGHYAAPSTIDGYKQIIEDIIGKGGTFYMAHPFDFGSNSFKPLDEFNVEGSIDEFMKIYKNQTGNEIMSYWQYEDSYNTTAKYSLRTLPALQLWDKLNIVGYKKYFGMANSDAHWTSALGMNKNGIYLEDFTKVAVNNAIATGSFYLTNGPELRFSMDGKIYGDSVIVTGETQVPVKIRAVATTSPLIKVALVKYSFNNDYKAGYAAREERVIFSDATAAENKQEVVFNENVTVKPNEFYRVEVLAKTTDSLVRQAYSNPIWITTAASSFSLDKDSLDMEVGASAKLNFNTDNVYDTVTLKVSDKNAIDILDNGFIKVKEGAAGIYTVTATTASGLTDTCEIKVSGGNNGNETEGGGCKNGINSSWLASALVIGGAGMLVKRKKRG